jgi:hypothetical protein
MIKCKVIIPGKIEFLNLLSLYYKKLLEIGVFLKNSQNYWRWR